MAISAGCSTASSGETKELTYLLVTHVPLAKATAAGRLKGGSMWIEDLRAQARAWAPYGRLWVAAPFAGTMSREASGSFDMVEIDPEAEGFTFLPLPSYRSWPGFAASFLRLRAQLQLACERADIVQADYGGYPVSLGHLAWVAAGRSAKPRIWVFDGADPFPRVELAVERQSNPFKRVLKRRLGNRFSAFCQTAVAGSDLVFAHNDAMRKRFRDEWHPDCHTFHRSFVQESFIAGEEELRQRTARILDRAQPLRIAVAGRQIPMKATGHVLRAMASAVGSGASLELDVIGDGDELTDYQKLANALGLSDRVVFHGAVPYGEKLFTLLRRSHVLAITNLTTEMSRNVLLGMALGLPVIAYQNAGTDDLIASGGSVPPAPSGDIEALGRTFFEVSRNRDLLAASILKGAALARTVTLDATHEKRAALAAQCLERRRLIGAGRQIPAGRGTSARSQGPDPDTQEIPSYPISCKG